MADLEKQFDEAMMNVYRTEKEECGYHATDFLQMLYRDRGLITAKRLLVVDKHHTGFEKLAEHGRLDITVECVVLNPKFRGLFDDEELERARQRLRKYDFDPAQCETASDA